MKTIYIYIHTQVWVENEDDIIDEERKKNKVGIKTRFGFWFAMLMIMTSKVSLSLTTYISCHIVLLLVNIVDQKNNSTYEFCHFL
jgi:hypothetical protein